MKKLRVSQIKKLKPEDFLKELPAELYSNKYSYGVAKEKKPLDLKEKRKIIHTDAIKFDKRDIKEMIGDGYVKVVAGYRKKEIEYYLVNK